jgi:hypothetical protein
VKIPKTRQKKKKDEITLQSKTFIMSTSEPNLNIDNVIYARFKMKGRIEITQGNENLKRIN